VEANGKHYGAGGYVSIDLVLCFLFGEALIACCSNFRPSRLPYQRMSDVGKLHICFIAEAANSACWFVIRWSLSLLRFRQGSLNGIEMRVSP
jgi:hypothetical protein